MRPDHLELTTEQPDAQINNGDGLCYYDLQKALVGLQINRAEATTQPGVWKLWPKDPMASFKDLRAEVQVNRNRDMQWTRTLDKKSAERLVGVYLALSDQGEGVRLELMDEDGHSASAVLEGPFQIANDPVQSESKLRDGLQRLGDTIFKPINVALTLSQPWFIPASQLNTLRRTASRMPS